MKAGDLVKYRRGSRQWLGIVLHTFVYYSIEGEEIKMVSVIMKDGIHTYKNWKLEVIDESR